MICIVVVAGIAIFDLSQLNGVLNRLCGKLAGKANSVNWASIHAACERRATQLAAFAFWPPGSRRIPVTMAPVA